MARASIIGLTGYARSGKDTFAKVLTDEYGYTRVAFADALKNDLAEYLGIERDQVNAEKKALRRTLQLRGGAKRKENPDYWIGIARRDITLLLARGHSVVITDVRFPNEAEAIRKMGGVVLRMRRADQPHVTTDADTSEQSVDLIVPDEVIEADSVEERQQHARDFMDLWLAAQF